MLPPAHFFVAYLVSDALVPNAKAYIAQILVFSFIVDLDHIPGILKILSLSREEQRNLTMKQVVDWCRTPIQEPIGIATILVLLGILYLSGIRSPLIPLAAIGVTTHYFVDFLSIHTRPLDPVDRRVVILYCDTLKRRLWVEGITTVVTGLLFMLAVWR